MSTENCTGAIPPIGNNKYLILLYNGVDAVNTETPASFLSFTELHRCNSALEISQ